MNNSIKVHIETNKGTLKAAFANTARISEVITFTVKHFKLPESDTYMLCLENSRELEADSTLRHCGLADDVVLKLEDLCDNGG